MRSTQIRLMFGVATGLVLASAACAGDAKLLGRGSADAPTLTLQGTDSNDVETSLICCWWKRWCCAPACPPVCCAPPVTYYAPTYYAPTYAPQQQQQLQQPQPTSPPVNPMAYYQNFQNYNSTPQYPPQYARQQRNQPTYDPRPSIVLGYQGRLLNGSLTLRPGIRTEYIDDEDDDDYDYRPRRKARTDRVPAHRSNGTFRYDGGPAAPIPMPRPDLRQPTEPLPATVPDLNRISLQQNRQVSPKYPAYGEKQVAPRMVIIDPLMVKRIAN